MLENLIEESVKSEKIAMNMVNKVYPDIDSLYTIKKGIDIIDKKKIIKKKKKIILNTPFLSIINGVLTYSEKLSKIQKDLPKYEKISVEVHSNEQKQIRIHKFKIGLDND